MAFNKFSSIITVLSLLSYSTMFTDAQSAPPSPSPSPSPIAPPPPTSPTPSPTASPPSPSPTPSPTASPPSSQGCPIDTLKLGVCTNLLGLINLGKRPASKCCAVIDGLIDFEAALCLCTALKTNVLGMNLNIPLDFSLIMTACQKPIPPDFKCA